MDFAQPPSYYGSASGSDGDEDTHAQILTVHSPARPPSYHSPTRPTTRRRRPRTAGGDRSGPGAALRERSHGHGHARVEHIITFRDTKEHPWAIVRLQSSAGSSSQQPRYRPGDDIVGIVELDLAKEKAIQGMTVSARGTLTESTPGSASPGQVYGDRFLDTKLTLWKPSMGDPRSSHFSSVDALSSRPSSRRGERTPGVKEFKERLLGEYSFPFAIKLPSVLVHDGISEPLPPTLCDPSAPRHVIYELEVTIQTALFKSDAIIKTTFLLAPVQTPSLPSPARELIYNCRSSMLPPGPLEDPEGWTVLPTVAFRGSLSSTDVGINCSMALANPLTYCRGYSIPLTLILSPNPTFSPSGAKRLLSLLTNSNEHVSTSVRICLLRTCTQYAPDSRKRGTSSKKVLKSTTDCVGVSSCWLNPSAAGFGAPGTKVVNGEIRLRKELAPSFEFRDFKLEYSVALLPFSNPALTTSSTTPATLIQSPITVVSGRPAVVPISHIPSSCKEPAAITFPDGRKYTVGGKMSLDDNEFRDCHGALVERFGSSRIQF